MRNSRLRKRLERLETTLIANSGWNVSSTDVHQAALAKLSCPDRFLIEEVYVRDPAHFLQVHGATWDRFDAALKEAILETGYPIVMRARDWFL